MIISGAVHESKYQLRSRRATLRDSRGQRQLEALTAELQASLTREEKLREENDNLLKRQDAQLMEFEHRLFNGLHRIVGLLSAQSRTAPPEAASQLKIAASRITAFRYVHRRLHLLNSQARVQFTNYLRELCEEIADLLFHERAEQAIVVQGASFEVPTTLAIPLSLIVNELITNAAKYAQGKITVRFETTSATSHSLSVLDDGPGLPTGFDPMNSKGLGMKIVLSLVKQIGGEFHILSGDHGRGACLMVTFCSPVHPSKSIRPR